MVWAVGDGANGSDDAVALADRIAASRVDRLLYLGDVYESGTAGEFREHYETVYGSLAARTAPTPGNHDWPNHAQGYEPYWRSVLGRPGGGYYVFRLGGWDILSLNSEQPHGDRSPQLAWLRGRLRKPGTCRLAFWHRPRYSAGTTHGDQSDVEPLWAALRGRASLVVNGHEHDLQRFRPIRGLTELIAGAGGAERYPVDRNDPRVSFADDGTNGALRLVLRPGVADYAFVSTDGRTLDAGRVPCRRR